MGWDVMEFGELYAIPSKNGLTRPARVRGRGYKMINMGELFAHDRIADMPMELVPMNEKEFTTMLVQPGDLLFARQSLVLSGAGKCSLVISAEEPTTFESHIIRVRLKNEIADSSFFHYYFKSPICRMRSIVTQGVQAGIRGNDLKRLKIHVPPLLEQRRIASILSAYDNLIENNRRRIQLLEQAARLLYKEWFVLLRYPGHEHTKIIDGVPEGWERKTLGNVATTNAESYKMNTLPEEINYIDISSVKQGRILSKTRMSSSEAPGRARRIGTDGDVIWSNVRPNLRAYALVLDPDGNDVFSTGFTTLSPVAIPFSYLYLSVTTDEFVGHLVNHTTGVSYPAVRPNDFERAEILLPARSALKIFHEKMEPAFRMIQILEKETKALVKARDLLLPKLMNGEVAV